MQQVVEVAITGSCEVCTGWQSPLESMAASRSTKSPWSSLDELTVVLGRLVKFNLAERLVEHRLLEGLSRQVGSQKKKKKQRCVPLVSAGNVARFSLSDCGTWSGCCFKLEESGCVLIPHRMWGDPSDSGSFVCQEGLSPGRRLESWKKA